MNRPVGIARRPRVAALVASALVLAGVAGCGKHHQRSVMRPVYASPPVVRPVSPCPGGDCGAGRAGAATISPGFGEGDTLSPAPSAAPSARPIGPPPAGAEPELSPATPTSKVGPELITPRTSRRTRRGAPQRTALRAQVEPFVNDPDDLFVPPKADRPWKYVVMHHSASPAGGYAQIDRDHRKVLGINGCGYHFIIGNGTESPDGQVEVAQRWAEQKGGAHCRDGKNADVNEYGIGICFVGDFDNAPPTARQVQAARALIAYLQDRYAIPADRIGTHAHVANGPTACPGRQFPADTILADLGTTAP